MRVARGACWVIVIALLATAGLALLDAALRLPGWVRGLGLAVWLTGVGVLCWRFVVQPWREESPGRNPVKQAREDLPGNLHAATAATLTLAGCLLVGAFVPGSVEHLRRVALPWQRPASSPYRVVVTSGESVVRRGGSVSLAAFAEKTDPAAENPTTATFVFRDRPGATETRVDVTVDENGVFHANRAGVNSDFEYRVEIGTVASDWFTVWAADPAEVGPGSTTQVHPPKYVTAMPPPQPGFGPVRGLQHGTAEFRLRFTRPAALTFLEFRPDTGPMEPCSVTLAADRLSGTASLRLRQNGTLRLVTIVGENGKKLRVESEVPVQVTTDAPPRFDSVGGLSWRPLRAMPGERMPVEFRVKDDHGIGGATLEVLRPGESQPVLLPIWLRGAGTNAASGRFELRPAGLPGEMLRFRIRVRDTRKLADPDVKPQEAVYPETGWATLTLDAAAPPLDVQLIQAYRDGTRDTLRVALTEAQAAATEADVLAADTAGQPTLTPDHQARLADIVERNRKAVEAMNAAARDAHLTLELRPLAAGFQEVSDNSLRTAADFLRQASTDDPARRPAALISARRSFSAAAERIEDLLATNERLARQRLDRSGLAALFAAQTALADSAQTDEAIPELARRQQELLTRFRHLLTESETLRTAADAARGKEAHRLAVALADLAALFRELDTATRQLHADTRIKLLAAIAGDHKAATKEAAELVAKLTIAARLTNAAVPRPEEFTRVTELILAGNSVQTLTELARLASAVDALAATFEKWATERTDPKLAARQLGLWQDDLRTRFRTAIGGMAANYNALPEATKAAFQAEQTALRKAVEAIQLPVGDFKTTRELVLTHLARVDNTLKGSGADADTAMKAVTEHLKRLADVLPTVSDRLIKTRTEFEKLRAEHDAILAAVEPQLRAADPAATAALARKLLPLLEKQQKLNAAFAGLDLPGHELRKARIVAALHAAAADLKEGLPLDVAASQAWVKREFDRLRLTLTDSTVPFDDRVEMFARKQVEIIALVEALGPNPTAKQLEPVAAMQAELTKFVSQLPVVAEAPSLRNDAIDAVTAAEAAFRNAKGNNLPQRLRVASTALAMLADRLNAVESDFDRVHRLAAARAIAAEEAKKLVGLPANVGASADAARQLGREIDELTHTRVGANGQLLKKRVLEQYAKLKEQNAPERQAAAQKQLADALEELAAKMADIAELTTSIDRKLPATVASEADAFLPSKPFADALRDVARRHRELRDRVSTVAETVLRQTTPGDAKAKDMPEPPTTTAAKHKGRAAVLLAQADDLVRVLEFAARDAGVDEPVGKCLADAASTARAAAKLLAEATTKSEKGLTTDAERLRTDAAALLQGAAGKAAGAAPEMTTLPELDPAMLATGYALRDAEIGMRRALAELGAKPDLTAAGNAMRSAAAALEKATK